MTKCKVKDYAIKHDRIPLPKYIIIENQNNKDLVIKDKNQRTLTIANKDKIVGTFELDQEITFPKNTHIYCRQISNVLYITNTEEPSWQYNFYLACGGINTKLDAKNMAPVILSEATATPFNIMFLISSIELHFRYFHPAIQPPEPDPQIPHIIHFIWLKGREFNAGYIQSWAQHHPEFTLYLWTDFEEPDNIPQNAIIKDATEIAREVNSQPPQIAHLFDDTEIPGIKSDILRYIVLHNYGGIYVDINDFECFKPITPLTYQYKFIAGLETCHADKDDGLLVNNAFIAAQPKHPILQRVLTALNTSRDIPQHEDRIDDYVCELSGPILFRMVTLGYFIDPSVKDKTRDILLPSVYLYPSCFYQSESNRHVNRFRGHKEKWLHNVTFAAHYSDHSYLPANG